MTQRDAKQPPLSDYRAKRHFGRTTEPTGVAPQETDAPQQAAATHDADAPRRVFVVQKHDASRLHYDFRLELDGVLKSWAIPKGPSLDPADKRLAVMVEDHPLEYATFEGGIPEGEYGGGTVMLWDHGWWEPDQAWMREATKSGKGSPLSSPEQALAIGELKFVLHGEKLTGSWALVKTGWRGQNNWLLMKHRDKAARPGSNIEEEAPDSVASGRNLEQIAADWAGAAPSAAAGSQGAAEES
jgi:bifunctional non-homologous end joining protein LigD